MDVCSQCGHQLGIGRFCTNCGHPVGAAPAPTSAATPPPAPPSASGRHLDRSRRGSGAAAWVPWVAALTTMLVLAGLGLWLLLDDAEPTSAPATATDPVASERPHRDTRTPEGRATLSAAPASEPTDLARYASVQAPAAAPPNHDLDGNQVRYDAANMVDGAPDTCWRMPGDGTGESIAFTFEAPTELYEVGLVNGYAKVATDGQVVLDWYAGNRRITRVEWTFDDGTTLVQRLGESREVQSVTLDDPVVTRRVTLRLLDVTPPGPGRASRDYTAISDVLLLGVPA